MENLVGIYTTIYQTSTGILIIEVNRLYCYLIIKDGQGSVR